MHIRALASGITEPQRTKRSQAYEGTTLRGIATAVARRHQFTVVGEIADVSLKRITQHQEGDLQFLKRIAGNYGYVFSVKGDQLVFSQYAKLRTADPVLTLNRVGDVSTYTLRDKTLKVYKDATCAYDDPKSKQCLTHTAKAKDVESGDTCKVTRRCENAEQAKLQSKAALEQANDGKFEGTLTMDRSAVIPLLIDRVTATAIPVLLEQFHVDFCRPDATETQRRQLIKRSVPWHRTKGTPGALRELVEYWYGITPTIRERGYFLLGSSRLDQDGMGQPPQTPFSLGVSRLGSRLHLPETSIFDFDVVVNHDREQHPHDQDRRGRDIAGQKQVADLPGQGKQEPRPHGQLDEGGPGEPGKAQAHDRLPGRGHGQGIPGRVRPPRCSGRSGGRSDRNLAPGRP